MFKKVLIGLGVLGSLVVGFLAYAVYVDKNRVREPDEAAFEAAEELIRTFKSEVGFGSDDAAKAIAFAFAKEMKRTSADTLSAERTHLEARLDAASTKAAGEEIKGEIDAIDAILSQGGISLSEGNFLTYVRVNPGSVVFLVHVPRLKKYQGKRRTTLLTMCWRLATKVAATELAKLAGERELVIALRGAVFYGAIAKDRFDATEPFLQTASSLKDEPLHRYFDPKLLTPLSAELPDPPAAAPAPAEALAPAASASPATAGSH